MYIFNRTVACTPFPSTSIKVEVKAGLPVMKHRAELTALQVVYSQGEYDDTFTPGTTVWVRGDACKHDFARAVYEVEKDKPFILVPQDMIVGWANAKVGE